MDIHEMKVGQNRADSVMGRERGYVVVLTGDGKGKTTSALGMAMRAVGQGIKVIMLQFLKGTWRYGEQETAKRLEPYFTLRPLGSGFIHVNPDNPDPADVQTARNAWEACKEALFSGDYGMVILDEINNAIAYGLLPMDDVLEALERCPQPLHVILTGRDAQLRLIEIADLVTEVKEIKHPYRQGASVRKGIEY
jgi:cob(I)alamin adenosyltransferase